MFSLNSASLTLQSAFSAVRRHFLWAAIFSALLNLLFIAPMLYMLQVYNRVVPTQGGVTLLFLTLVLLFALATLSLLDYVRSRLLVRASMRLDRRLAAAVLDATLAPNRGQQGRQSVRELDTLRQTLTGTGIIALFDVPWVPVYVLIAFMIHPYVGLLASAGALVLIFLAWRNEVATREPLQRANESAARAYATHDLTMAAADVVRALGMRRMVVQRHSRERETMMALQTDASFAASGWLALSKFVRLLLQSLALGIGALLAINNQISPGAIFASMFIVGRALAPIDQVIGAWKGIIHARGAYRTLNNLFGQLPPALAVTQLPPPQGRLEIDQVTMFTSNNDGVILQNVSFSVSPGEVVGIVGPSGAGKSTLIRAIAGAAAPDRGTVRFDGAEQRDWDPEQLAQHIGYMPQETSLFAGTIKENITRFRVEAGEDRATVDAMAIEAARLAGAHDLILGLPRAYDYQLGLGGAGLSAGQAQRIALARALFGSPRYLLLDEPNAHLDQEGDVQLVTTLSAAKKRGMTILLVAHRLSVLPVIDKLLVVKDGALQLYGPREEVMRRIAPKVARAVPQHAAG